MAGGSQVPIGTRNLLHEPGIKPVDVIQNIAAIPQQWLIANERLKSGGTGGGGGKKAA